MKLGAEDKTKMKVLGVLLALAGGSFIYNSMSSDQPPSSAPRPSSVRPTLNTPATPAAESTQRKSLVNRNSKGDEFHPALRKKGPRTGEEITIPAGRRVSFTAGSGLLEPSKGPESGKRAA